MMAAAVAGPTRRGQATCAAVLAQPRARLRAPLFASSKLIPEGPCAKAGDRYEGAPTVHGPHANSRWLCDSQQQAEKRSSSKGEAVIVDIIPPSALPADRFGADCQKTSILNRISTLW